MGEEKPDWFKLSALTVVLILNLSVIIVIAKNKRNWRAVNVFIAGFALNGANLCWPLLEIFKTYHYTQKGCKVHSFIGHTSLILSYFILPTIFVIIVKFKQMRWRAVCVVILVEFAVSAICALPFVYHYEVHDDGERNTCVVRFNPQEEGMKKQVLMSQLIREALCLILALMILVAKHKRFKFGRSLAFLLATFMNWFPNAATNFVFLMEIPIQFSDFTYKMLNIVVWIGFIAKPICCLMMIERGDENPSESRLYQDVELVANRNQ
jgi:hypothetical protein